MQRVIRVIKAVPWALFCRLSFKALCLLGVALIAILSLVWKAAKFLLSDSTENDPNRFENDDTWTAYQPGARQLRPDQAPFGPAEDD